MPKQFGEHGANHIPQKAIYFVGAVSFLIPFVGRTAIGWIVDVTTIGATIIYALTCATAVKLADQSGDRREVTAGKMGLCLMAVFGAYLLSRYYYKKYYFKRDIFAFFGMECPWLCIFQTYTEARYGKTLRVIGHSVDRAPWTRIICGICLDETVYDRL